MLSARDREQQRAAANEAYGRKNYLWVLFGRTLTGWGLAAAGLLVGGTWLVRVATPARVSYGLGALGLLLLVGYGVWLIKSGTARARMMNRARGRVPSPRWHLVGAAGLLLTVAAITMYAAP